MVKINPMRWIYLSPHLDDAALSAGGWIFDQTRAGIP
ncbi:MAG: PIG-L family deacetylase, partial [Chloroflexi bacterium CFX2]|nr:PIG-L family deacetylase [Chloroflexi bacterium CFX2]